MRVLMFGWEFPPYNSGGLGVACRGLARALIAEGVELTFVLPVRIPVSLPGCTFLFAYEQDEWEKLTGSTKTVHAYASLTHNTEADAAQTVYDQLQPLSGSLFAQVLAYAARAPAIARKVAPDVIHAHDWLCFPAGLAAKRAACAPLIAHVHATEYDRTGGSGQSGDIWAVERMGVQGADMVVAVSHYTKALVSRHYDIPAERIEVLHNGIDEDEVAAKTLRRLHALKRQGNHLVLFVGRLTLQKGPDAFVRIAERVCKKMPNVYFVIAGSGDMEAQVIREAAMKRLGTRVLFAGFVRDDDRAALYGMADCLVMPSVSEPFGIVPLEALASGVPVIISKQSGVREVLHHALVADFWDTNAFADKLIGVLKRPALKNFLAREGGREVAGLSWRTVASRCMALYHKLLGGLFS